MPGVMLFAMQALEFQRLEDTVKQLSEEVDAREIAEVAQKERDEVMIKVKELSGRLAKVEKSGQLQHKQTAEVVDVTMWLLSQLCVTVARFR